MSKTNSSPKARSVGTLVELLRIFQRVGLEHHGRQALANLEKIVFAAAALGLSFAFGVAVAEYKIFPYQLIKSGVSAGRDLHQNWRSYAGIVPVKHLESARYEGNGVTIHDPQKSSPGLTFMVGLFDGRPSLQLVDISGKIIHRWVPDFDEIWSEMEHERLPLNPPFNEWDLEIHGATALPDGSVIFNSYYVLVKLDKCGRLMWKRPYGTHHSIFLSEDETYWIPSMIVHDASVEAFPQIEPPFIEDTVLQLSKSGEILREISVPQLLLRNELGGILFPTRTYNKPFPEQIYGFTHLNDIEVLQTAIAGRFPLFEPGDVLVSLRDVNLLVLFDPDTLKVKWYKTGPWQRQHDPDFLPNGKISVFNNNDDTSKDGGIFGGSSIMLVDPADGATQVLYGQRVGTHFYTDEMGKDQHLPNGNFLVTEAKAGRAFEFNKNLELVWEYINRYDEDRVALITSAERFESGYFAVDTWRCE